MTLHTPRFTHYRSLLISAFATASLMFTAPASRAGDARASDSVPKPDFSHIEARLIADGVPESTVIAYFTDPRFGLEPEVLSKNIRQPSGTAGYERFVGEESVNNATAYLKAHRKELEEALGDSPVDPAVVVAILQVESSLGTYKGTYPLMNVYASLALLEDREIADSTPGFWDAVLHELPPNEHPAAREKALSRGKRKANWAYRQLKALLMMADKGQMDPLEAKGSWAGAYGMSQFIPTSAEAYARDGNGDGKINLDSLKDAAASVANYLKIHRYRHDNPAKRRKAVWHYNHSDEYVDCILTLADRIEAKLKSDSSKAGQ